MPTTERLEFKTQAPGLVSHTFETNLNHDECEIIIDEVRNRIKDLTKDPYSGTISATVDGETLLLKPQQSKSYRDASGVSRDIEITISFPPINENPSKRILELASQIKAEIFKVAGEYGVGLNVGEQQEEPSDPEGTPLNIDLSIDFSTADKTDLAKFASKLKPEKTRLYWKRVETQGEQPKQVSCIFLRVEGSQTIVIRQTSGTWKGNEYHLELGLREQLNTRP